MASASEASQQANRAGMDPLRLVVIFLLLSALVLGLFFEQIIAAIFPLVRVNDPIIIEGTDGRLSTVLGFALSIGLAIFVWVNASTKQHLNEVATELMKVTWPSWSETRVATVAVVVASVVAAVILFGIDTLAYQVMVNWLPALWRML